MYDAQESFLLHEKKEYLDKTSFTIIKQHTPIATFHIFLHHIL